MAEVDREFSRWNHLAGGGCQDDDCGLTSLGRRIVDEMADCGMIACCSHTGYRTAREVIDYSPDPVIFSHSNPRAVKDHHRNIPDELIPSGLRSHFGPTLLGAAAVVLITSMINPSPLILLISINIALFIQWFWLFVVYLAKGAKLPNAPSEELAR